MLSKGITPLEPSMFSFLYQFRKCKGCIGTIADVEFLQEGQCTDALSGSPAAKAEDNPAEYGSSL